MDVSHVSPGNISKDEAANTQHDRKPPAAQILSAEHGAQPDLALDTQASPEAGNEAEFKPKTAAAKKAPPRPPAPPGLCC